MKINALCTSDPMIALNHCDRVVYCGENRYDDERVDVYNTYIGQTDGGNIYIHSMLDDDLLNDACDYILNNGVHAIVRAAYDLTEAGLIEARHKLSPIMLLHKYGVLDRCTIAGGVCLDNDDLDLMAQEGVPLVVLPTYSAGSGHGYAPVCAAVARGIRVGIGTFDGAYNPAADIDGEIRFLNLTANAAMSKEGALSQSDMDRILRFQ